MTECRRHRSRCRCPRHSNPFNSTIDRLKTGLGDANNLLQATEDTLTILSANIALDPTLQNLRLKQRRVTKTEQTNSEAPSNPRRKKLLHKKTKCQRK